MKFCKEKAAKPLALLLVFAMLLCNSALLCFAENKTLNYLVLGDSIGWGAGVFNCEEACYGRIVADSNGYNFTNDAVNGHTSTDLIRRLETAQVAKDVENADIISISVGGNDFLRSNMALLIFEAFVMKNYRMFDEIVADYYENFCVIIEKIKALNPDAVLLVQTLYNPRYDFLRDAYQEGVNRLNACYPRYLEEHPGAFTIVDVAAALEGKQDCVAADTIHPSAKGNVEIARLVLQTLYDMKLGTATEPLILNAGIDAFDFNFTNLVNSIKFFVKLFINNLKLIFA